MNLKGTLLFLLLAAFMLLLLSCGGTSLTPEEALTKRAESLLLEISNENWLEGYKYLSPRTREICKSGEFAVSVGMGFAMLKGFMGIPEDEKITFSVLRVTVDGDIGRAYTEMKYDDDVIEFDEDDGQGWVYVDDEWWQEDDDWESTCEFE